MEKIKFEKMDNGFIRAFINISENTFVTKVFTIDEARAILTNLKTAIR